jgi:hypothetical protein
MTVRTLTLGDDPQQVLSDLNAAFDGTTQTDLNAKKVNGYSASQSVVANNVVVRKSDGKIAGDIDGKSTTATLAETANLANASKGDKRFWISSNIGKDITINPGTSIQIYQNFIDADATLKLKRIRTIFSNNIVINISTSGSGGSSYQPSSVITDYNLDHLLCNAGNITLSVKAVNISSSPAILSFDSGWWLELAIE